MLTDLVARRALLMVVPDLVARLRELFGQGLLRGWETLEADSLEQARYLLQHHPCDAWLADEGLFPEDGLIALTRHYPVHLLVLGRDDGPEPAPALGDVAGQRLPRSLILEHPLLLAGALNLASQMMDLRRRAQEAASALQRSRHQVDRLVGLMWRTLPADVESGWLSQRHLLERFAQEVGRAGRYGTPLTIVLAEAEDAFGDSSSVLDEGVAGRVLKTKRCSDVVGQYGPRGFVVLLVHTGESGAVAYCRRLAKVLGQRPGPDEEWRPPVRWHFGIAGYSAAAATTTRLLGLAEQNLESARTGGPGFGAAV
jgi:GGDEF domain-containing protein